VISFLTDWANMKQKSTQSLYAYWNEVRAGRLAPRRFEIEPSQISEILPDTFILERADSETFRFRLAGTAICEHFGQEFRDTNFLDGWTEPDRITLQRLLAVVTIQGAVGLIDLEAATPSGDSVVFETILLPLVHTRDSVDRILGAMAPISQPGWLGHEVLSTRSLLRSQMVWPNGKPQSVIDALHRQAPFLPHIRKARIVRSQRRQFRVYDGGLMKSIEE
jgi:hypothetical protein